MKPFEPDERQQQLIDEAIARSRTDGRDSPFASAELVDRMTEEARHVGESDASSIHVTLVATIDERMSREELAEWIGTDGCIGATTYELPQSILVVEFYRAAASRCEAVELAVDDVRRRLPEAIFVDINDPNTLLDNLVETTTKCPLSDGEIMRLMVSVAPDRGVAYEPLVRNMRKALANDPGGDSWRAQPRAAWTEATVVEVLPGRDLVHLTTGGGIGLTFNRQTPVSRGLVAYEEGQLYRCLVLSRLSVVLRAELVERQ